MKRLISILLVEDDSFCSDFISSELSSHGYLVQTASNGLSAMKLIESNKFDVVITDIFMPDMDGIELIQNLRKNSPNLPIFVLTAGGATNSPEDFLRYAKKFGANELLTKPVDIEVIINKLKQY